MGLPKTFHHWACLREFHKPSIECPQITHIRLNGGKYYVPRRYLFEFYEGYTYYLGHSEDHFICESLNNVSNHRFYCDLDIELSVKEWETIDLKQHIIMPLYETLNEYFNDRNIFMIVCKSNATGLKRGLHLIFPNVIVIQSQAVTLCGWLLEQLIQKHPTAIDWKKIMDTGVYRSGLRMLYSFKLKERTQYHVAWTHPSMSNETFQPKNKSKFRETFGSHELKRFMQIVDCSIFNIYNEQAIVVSATGSSDTIPSECSPIDEKSFYEIQQFVNEHIPKYWKSVVSQVKHYTNPDHYVLRLMSRYCYNLDSEHHSENVFFVISPINGFYQKCFCSCNTKDNRRFGLCKDFKSYKHKPIRLSERLFKHLFPDKKQSEDQKLPGEKIDLIYQPSTKQDKSKKLESSLAFLKHLQKT
jgi:hypothetical protein